MSDPLDLSIVVLTHNTCALTLACLRSIDAEPNPDRREVLVVDNASTDGTADALQRNHPTARVLRSEVNLGFGGGNNVGLKAARGRHVLLLNSDTEVRPGALAALVAFMDAHPEVGACGPKLLNSDGSLQPSGRALPSLGSVFVDMTRLYRLTRRNVFGEAGRDYNVPRKVGEISGAALLLRRAVYDRIGGFDPGFFLFYEDVDLCKRVNEAGCAVYYVPAAEVVHHWGGTMRAISRTAHKAGEDSLRWYFAKHHGRFALGAVSAMLAGKEALLWLAGAVRGDDDAAGFHRAMLQRALGPLP